MKALRGSEEDEREKRRNGEWETKKSGDVFLGNPKSSQTVIPNPGSPGRRNPVP